jgi:hypothetical protein
MTIRPVVPSDLPQLTELAATPIRETVGPPHHASHLVAEYVASADIEEQHRSERTNKQAIIFMADEAAGQLAKLRWYSPPRRPTERNAIKWAHALQLSLLLVRLKPTAGLLVPETVMYGEMIDGDR